MVLQNLFNKASSKHQSDNAINKENRRPSSSSRSPKKRTPSKSPTKTAGTRDSGAHSSRTRPKRSPSEYTTDTHPLNLPPDERERRRSAMSSPSDPLTPMDVDLEAGLGSSSPPSATNVTFKQANGVIHDNMATDAVNGEDSPVPPPHGSNPVASPPPKPALDPEACKAVGNKYFKAKDYTKAVQEYSKGMHFSSGSSRYFSDTVIIWQLIFTSS